MPGYRARPSVLGPVAAAAGLSLGAAAGLLPTKLSHAITGMLTPHVFREQQGTLHVGLLLTVGLLCSSWPLPWSCGCAVTHYTVSCYQ